MKVKELIEQLQQLNPELHVMISESYGFLGADGAYETVIQQDDADNCGDCEYRVGESIVAISKM